MVFINNQKSRKQKFEKMKGKQKFVDKVITQHTTAAI